MKNADIFFLVEVYRDLLMICVVPKYKEFKKFNLQQLVRSEDAEAEDAEPKRCIKLSDLIGKRLIHPDTAGELEESINEDDVSSSSEEEAGRQEVAGQSSSSDEEEVRLI
jgi:hypothetical protein